MPFSVTLEVMDHITQVPTGETLTPLPGVQVTEDLDWLPTITAQVRVPASEARDARRGEHMFLRIWDPEGPHPAGVGIWHLRVRECVTDYQTGTATLTLTSPDILLLGVRYDDMRADDGLNLYQLHSQVRQYIEPGNPEPPGLGTRNLRHDPSTLLYNLTTLVGIPRPWWRQGQSAADYLTLLGHYYGGVFMSHRDGNLLAYRGPDTTQVHTITDDTLLSLSRKTSGEDFFNQVVVTDPDTGDVKGIMSAGGDYATTGPAGRRVALRPRPVGTPTQAYMRELLERSMRHGETWQITAREHLGIEPGHLLHLDSARYGIEFTEPVTSVSHTSDGVMTININPEPPEA